MELTTSQIPHPPNSRFIIRRFYQVKACQSDADKKNDSVAEVAAELLSIFEYHTNNPLANKIFESLVKAAKKKHGRQIKETFGWLPYSYTYLQECLDYARGRSQIIKAVERLIEKGFLSADCPNSISLYYSQNQNWYLLQIEALTALADRVRYGINFEGGEDVPEVPVQPDRPLTKKEKLDNLVLQICEFHRHIHAKPLSYVYNSKARKKVRDRYTERVKIVGEENALALCILAIIGNRYDDFYQGNHPKNDLTNGGRVFDSAEHIFKDTAFDKFLESADSAGVTEEIALAHFKAFGNGEPSKFAKEHIKRAQNRSTAQESSKPAPSKIEIARYRNFAKRIVSNFLDGKRAKDILEACLLDDDLGTLGNGLIDADTLETQIADAAMMFTETLSAKVKVEIKQFSAEFTENEIANLEE